MGVLADLHRHLCGISKPLRRNDGQQSVAASIFGDNANGFRITVCIRIRENIDGITATPVGRKKIVQSVDGIGRENGQLATCSHQRVGGENTRSAGVGDDGQVWTARPRLFGQRLGDVEEVGDVRTRKTPKRRKAASRTSSLPASEPVCEAARRRRPRSDPP